MVCTIIHSRFGNTKRITHSILDSVVRFSLVKVLVWLGVVIKVKRQESAAKRLRIRDCVWRASGCQPADLCQGRRGTTTGIPTDRLTCVPQTHPPPAAVIPDQSCFLPSCCSTTALSQSGVPECLEFLGLVC